MRYVRVWADNTLSPLHFVYNISRMLNQFRLVLVVYRIYLVHLELKRMLATFSSRLTKLKPILIFPSAHFLSTELVIKFGFGEVVKGRFKVTP